MYNSFRWRLTGTFLIIILSILVASGVILSLIFKNYYIDDVTSNLLYQAKLVAQITSYYDNYDQQSDVVSFLQNVADEVAFDTNSRVTIIDKNGLVLADSLFDASKMDLHNTRPEVFQALNGKVGTNIRFSDTADIKMLYVAIPFDNGEVQGVIRLAKTLTEVQNLYYNILYVLFLGIIVTGLVAFLISIGIAKRFANPIQELTETVRDIAQGNLKRRIAYQSDDELGILAKAVNNMTDYLEKTISEISKVKNRFEVVLENTVNGIVLIDTKGKVAYANPVAAELLTGDRDFAGRSYAEVINNYELISIIDNVISDLRPIQEDVLMYAKGEKIVEVNVVPIINKNNTEHNGVLLVLNDITELKRLEKVRKDFVANVSHELKTPVATISGFAETLMAEGSNSDNTKEFSSIIYQEAQHLSKLISRLLELSRLESGKLEFKRDDLILKSVINSTVELITKRLNIKSDRIIVNISNPEIKVKGDYDFVSQILINLLENAVNYSPEDEKIVIEVKEGPNDVKILVTDKGYGIPLNEQDRIFERFYRVDKARSKKTGGTGLGLAIVKHLVENQGGIVGVESKVGAGSTFFFTLPKC